MSIRAALDAADPVGLLPLDPSPAGTAVDQMLVHDRDAEGDRPHAFNRRLRASWAGGCSRKMGFELVEFPPDLATEAKSLRIFDAGDRIHELIQTAMVRYYNAEIEVPSDWGPEINLGCNLDGVYPDPVTTGFEIKSMAPFGFELATGQRRRDELPGPKFEHVLQSGLGTLAPTVNGERLHLIYYNKANSDIADWIFGVDEPLPHLEDRTVREMVSDELRRMAGILSRIDNGELPKAVIPGFGVVTNPPARGSKGQPWLCRYCDYQPTCASLGPEAIRLSALRTDPAHSKGA